MKKLFFALLVLFLMGHACAEETIDVSGPWYLNSAFFDAVFEAPNEELADPSYMIVLNSDGTIGENTYMTFDRWEMQDDQELLFFRDEDVRTSAYVFEDEDGLQLSFLHAYQKSNSKTLAGYELIFGREKKEVVLRLAEDGYTFFDTAIASGSVLDEDLYGDWYLDSVVIEDNEGQDSFLMGMNFRLTFEEDGSLSGSGIADSWTLGHLSIQFFKDGEQVGTGELENGVLTFVHLDGAYAFFLNRERNDPREYIHADLLPDPTMQDFEGTWVATTMEFDGIMVDMADYDMHITEEIAIDSPNVSIFFEADQSVPYTYPMVLEDGVLIFLTSPEEYRLLLADGRMIAPAGNSGTLITTYYEKIN